MSINCKDNLYSINFSWMPDCIYNFLETLIGYLVIHKSEPNSHSIENWFFVVDFFIWSVKIYINNNTNGFLEEQNFDFIYK